MYYSLLILINLSALVCIAISINCSKMCMSSYFLEFNLFWLKKVRWYLKQNVYTIIKCNGTHHFM